MNKAEIVSELKLFMHRIDFMLQQFSSKFLSHTRFSCAQSFKFARNLILVSDFVRMSYTPDSLEQHLKQLGVNFRKILHSPPVMTVADMQSALKEDDGKVVKNMFLKDKKGRFYMVSSLPETEVKVNVLGARLGQGKTLRFAQEEFLDSVLKVPKGSVTPLAVCQDSAKDVILLLDQKLKAEEKIIVHPLTNSASVVISSTELELILRSFGRDVNYVDLELEPKFSKDNPGDLKHLADAVTPPEKQNGNDDSNGKIAGSSSNTNKTKKEENGKNAVSISHQADDVDAIIDSLVKMIKQKTKEALTVEDEEHLRKDFFIELNALRNAAYAGGYSAAMGAVSNFAQGKQR
eukprot:TRINITY_DN47543_c0_g1_i2.p2 TRINITY_DN47543_c0_g1~~TRINITY_DN47543_c0_g1_i2.p2  ORF type:complete len:348 (-),score=46.19 TRINITY_DN47543_c0_g1_i2:264-1307(-)